MEKYLSSFKSLLFVAAIALTPHGLSAAAGQYHARSQLRQYLIKNNIATDESIYQDVDSDLLKRESRRMTLLKRNGYQRYQWLDWAGRRICWDDKAGDEVAPSRCKHS